MLSSGTQRKREKGARGLARSASAKRERERGGVGGVNLNLRRRAERVLCACLLLGFLVGGTPKTHAIAHEAAFGGICDLRHQRAELGSGVICGAFSGPS